MGQVCSPDVERLRAGVSAIARTIRIPARRTTPGIRVKAVSSSQFTSNRRFIAPQITGLLTDDSAGWKYLGLFLSQKPEVHAKLCKIEQIV